MHYKMPCPKKCVFKHHTTDSRKEKKLTKGFFFFFTTQADPLIEGLKAQVICRGHYSKRTWVFVEGLS